MRYLVVAALLLPSCRMPDMFSLNPYYGDMVMERSNGLDHHEWGLGVSFTWDLNPGRYTDPRANAHPRYLILNADGTYWPKGVLEDLKSESGEETSEVPEDSARIREALESLGLDNEVRN